MAPRAGISCVEVPGAELDWHHLGATASTARSLGQVGQKAWGGAAGREMSFVKPVGVPLGPSLYFPLPPRSQGFEWGLPLATKTVLTNRSLLVRKPYVITPSTEGLIQTETDSRVGVGTSPCRQPAGGREGEAQVAGDLRGLGEAEASPLDSQQEALRSRSPSPRALWKPPPQTSEGSPFHHWAGGIG